MREKGKYRVNLVNVVDFSELIHMLGGFKWFGKDVDYECLYINTIDKEVCKGFRGFRGDIFGGYCSVTCDEMIEILSKPKDLGDNAKTSLVELHNTVQQSTADNASKLLTKIQVSTFEELDSRATKAHEKETLKQNIDILNDHLLNGTRIQFQHSGEQWHNVTGKFKLEQLKNKSIKLRVRPDRVSIDGYMLTPKQAIDYINRNYDNG